MICQTKSTKYNNQKNSYSKTQFAVLPCIPFLVLSQQECCISLCFSLCDLRLPGPPHASVSDETVQAAPDSAGASPPLFQSVQVPPKTEQK